MGKWILAVTLALGVFAHAAPTGSDLKLARKHAVQDLMLLEKTRRQDFSAQQSRTSALPPNAIFQMLSNNNCNTDGAGSAACWRACSNEGYSSSTCAGRCGVTTNLGSEACWNSCKTEGYSSSTCAGRCGVTTDLGSAACWSACSNEGYSSSTCAGRCGVDTAGGSEACWAACTREGYSSSTCAGRCGTN